MLNNSFYDRVQQVPLILLMADICSQRCNLAKRLDYLDYTHRCNLKYVITMLG